MSERDETRDVLDEARDAANRWRANYLKLNEDPVIGTLVTRTERLADALAESRADGEEWRRIAADQTRMERDRAVLRERDEALAAIERVRVALSNHPRCEEHPDGDVISCGWKRAVLDVQSALDGGDQS